MKGFQAEYKKSVPEPFFKLFKVHSRTAKFVMNFKITPYCENGKEDMTDRQIFFVGTDKGVLCLFC